MNWFVFAARNLLRNQRRSAVTILAAAFGFAAVNVFGGFTTYMFDNLRDGFIYAGGNGHLQIFRTGYKENATTDPGKYLVPGELYERLTHLPETDGRIRLVAGTMELTGQLDAGDRAGIFVAKAFQPSHRDVFFKESKTLGRGASFLDNGTALSDESPNEIGIANGVERILGLKIGADVALMARTVDGQINVVDATVRNTFASPSSELDEKLIVLPLRLAQDLVQTEGVGRIAVLLKHRRDIPAVEKSLQALLEAEGGGYEVKRWDEESEFYQLTKKMFNMIFGIVFLILIGIVSMSVMNTMSMAIIERTTEIGTLRALGLRRAGVIRLFAMEGMLIGAGGALAGMILSFIVWLFIKIQSPVWTPPTIGRKVPLEIGLVPEYLLMTTIFLIVLTFAAAVIPARRASGQGIVEALGHV
ncbi:MAG: putative ABC transport system permease protein [Verrucomicrobia bacterium]|nr:MAG: putative ABC transport system permease protein [Verrucomicrobiota bacterium]